MIDSRLLYQIEQILGKLHTPISLLDIEGNSLIPASDIRFSLPQLAPAGEAIVRDGRLYQVCTAEPEWVLMTAAVDGEGGRDAFILCDAMISAMQELKFTGLTGSMVWSSNGEVDKVPTAMVIKDGVYVGLGN